MHYQKGKKKKGKKLDDGLEARLTALGLVWGKK